jgi:RHS repeat-associated protein
VSATYDALDRMVEQSTASTNSQIVYSPSGGKLALMNGATLTKAFIPLPGGATAVYTSSGLAYYRHTDHLGSSRFASTPTQTLYSDTAYSPFGEPYASSGAIDNSFTGQNQDTLPGLYDFLYREYDPTQSRWSSPDPAGLASVNPAFPQSWNRYSYVLNGPLSQIDPTGLSCLTVTYEDADGNTVAVLADDGDGQGCSGAGVAPGNDPNGITPDQVFVDGGPCAGSTAGGGCVSVSADPGSFLDFVFSPSQPLYVPNDVPLPNNARIVLGTVSRTTGSLGNPCTIAAFYGSTASAAVTFGGTAAGASFFPELNAVSTAFKASAVGKSLPYIAASSAAGKFVGLFDGASNAVQKACNALQ